MSHAVRDLGRTEATKSARARRRPWQWSARVALLSWIAIASLPLRERAVALPAMLTVAAAPMAALNSTWTRRQLSRRVRASLRRVRRNRPVPKPPPAPSRPIALWITTTEQGVMVCYGPAGVGPGSDWEPLLRSDESPAPAGWAAASPAAAPAHAVAAAPSAQGLSAGTRGRHAQRSQHCILFAVDVARFTDAKRDDEVQLAIREALYRALIESFESSGIPWDACVHEDRGDGVLIVIPAQMPTATIVGPLVDVLGARLRRHNRLSSPAAQIRLRVAVHIGEVHWDRRGLAGTAVNTLFRMLDAGVLREALRATEEELALLVSDYLYESVIRGGPGPVAPGAFRSVSVQVKQFRTRAWLRDRS